METLITVVILGILAAILVPNLIKNQVENANRTKVKKAMASYEKAINYMIIENDIRETEALRELGQDNCQYTKEYFKIVQDGANNCIFKTADRVWWDITDITNPILILKDSQLDKSKTELKTLAKNVNDNTVFALVGRFDDLGTLRINDNAYEQGLENNFTNQKYVGKLWYFITQSTSVLTGLQKCQAEGTTTCTITVNGKEAEYELVNITNETISDLCIYNRVTKHCEEGTSNAYAGKYYIAKFTPPSQEEAKSEENCDSSVYPICLSEGDYYEAAKRTCELQGAKLANAAELRALAYQSKLGNSGSYFAYEENTNNYTAFTVDYTGKISGSGAKKFSYINFVCLN